MARKPGLVEPPIRALGRAIEAHKLIVAGEPPALPEAELETELASQSPARRRSHAQRRDERGRFA